MNTATAILLVHVIFYIIFSGYQYNFESFIALCTLNAAKLLKLN
jgi:hypothetical protein